MEEDRKFYVCDDCDHEFSRDTRGCCVSYGSLSYYWMLESEREEHEKARVERNR